MARPHARGCAAAGRLGDVVFGSYPGSKLLFMVVVVRARPRQPPPRAFECAARSKLRSAANRASGRDRDSSKRARSDEHFGLLLSPAAREKSIGGGGGSKAKPRRQHSHGATTHTRFLSSPLLSCEAGEPVSNYTMRLINVRGRLAFCFPPAAATRMWGIIFFSTGRAVLCGLGRHNNTPFRININVCIRHPLLLIYSNNQPPRFWVSFQHQILATMAPPPATTANDEVGATELHTILSFLSIFDFHL